MQHSAIIEDHLITRVMIRNLLAQGGLAVQEVKCKDGLRAVLSQPDAVDVLVLSLDTELVDPRALLTSIRKRWQAAHIVGLLPEGMRPVLPTLVSEGLDDFVFKPADVKELSTRLQLSLRTARLRQELASQGDAEVTGRSRLAMSGFPALFGETLGQLGLTDAAPVDADEAAAGRAFTAWSTVILRRQTQAEWMLLRIDTSHAAADALFAKLVGMAPGSDEERLDGMKEALNMLQGVVQTQAARLSLLEAHLPYIPRAVAADDLDSDLGDEKALRFGLRSGDVTLHVEGTAFPATVSRRTAAELQVGDVLALPAIGLARGIRLDAGHVVAIRDALAGEAEKRIAVYSPPAELAPLVATLDA